jgi:hypothetical protein
MAFATSLRGAGARAPGGWAPFLAGVSLIFLLLLLPCGLVVSELEGERVGSVVVVVLVFGHGAGESSWRDVVGDNGGTAAGGHARGRGDGGGESHRRRLLLLDGIFSEEVGGDPRAL